MSIFAGVLGLGWGILLTLLYLQRRAFQKRLSEAEFLLTQAQKGRALILAESARYERLYKLHWEKNEAFERQRDEIWKMYQLEGLQAGNAQSMLFRELEKAVGLLNGYRQKEGKTPIVMNPSIRNSIEEFKRDHGSHPEQAPEIS